MGAPYGGTHAVPAGTPDVQPSVGPNGDQYFSSLLPDLATAAACGMLITATQAAAGVAPGTLATTSTPAFTIWWTAANIQAVYIVDVSAGYVSGTIGAGHIMFGEVAATSAPTGGTAITAYNAKTGQSDSRVSCGTGHTTTAMSASTDRFPVLNLYATLATAPAASIGPGIDSCFRQPVNRWLPANTAGCFYGVSAAGSSPLIRMSVRAIIVTTLPS